MRKSPDREIPPLHLTLILLHMPNLMMSGYPTPKSATCFRSARLFVSDSKSLLLYSMRKSSPGLLLITRKNGTEFPSKGDCGVFPSYKPPSQPITYILDHGLNVQLHSSPVPVCVLSCLPSLATSDNKPTTSETAKTRLIAKAYPAKSTWLL